MKEERVGFCVKLEKTRRREGLRWKLELAIKRSRENGPGAIQAGEVQVALLRNNQLQM